MTDDVLIRREGRAGRITLNRPKALNALTWDMVSAMSTALDDWKNDTNVDLLIIDAKGEKAFCSGGDIADMYASGQRHDLSYGRRFWADEYRLNAKIYRYPKPVVTFLQGYTMGGGVGVGCHGSHRIVDDSSRIAMPECSIGLVPDVGGSLLLARAPGRLGEFLGLSGARMTASDAIYCGFADHYVPDNWQEIQQDLAATGDTSVIPDNPPPASALADALPAVDAAFDGATHADIMRAFPNAQSSLLASAKNRMDQNAPLAMAVATKIIRRVRDTPTIENALDHEYRYTFRAVAQGDFIEGIRAAIIDKDRRPKWTHADWRCVTENDVQMMTEPLGPDALFAKETK